MMTGICDRIDLRDGLPADPLLEHGEGQDPAILEGEDLAIDDRPIGQRVSQRGQLRITLGDQLLAARPEKRLSAIGG